MQEVHCKKDLPDSNAFDGNGDLIADSQQKFVASIETSGGDLLTVSSTDKRLPSSFRLNVNLTTADKLIIGSKIYSVPYDVLVLRTTGMSAALGKVM